ncbi:MAG: bifunctional 5,10-methylene-tetrahydrofolate dehydrogenase/5,10-methylene-tetrahydrofolate cyclohydrolase [Gammaproteobacteria bacterium]|nr:bifunctional 5,10-methylene-tetrahydrofolate dehydrogenase/5,10-methylene-tetrahydrofolate cyclohydrolase [Gammaproteobacteria bacterium]MDD9895157.1 bifunctional 5,10-methylene-tetrahydrofolate dehydrogenase/5,10-methylene-tetrahydrofolate cyclohydrolase [Gammaproteobacteria bacterium]MDD9958542.1 bifunctional 5,10-methylene-tetrahydrofolate dehydrogenase/5,10-methylene-tetrahydrofolate cyclohydrolase [Gammaproteobacteria bacterium]
MQLLDGTSCSQQIRQEIAEQVEQLKASGKRAPHLAAVLVGHDGASQNYVGMKARDCDEVGFNSTVIRMEESVSEQELLDKIAELNADDEIDGFIVQLPLPDHMDEDKVILAIDPRKDVDGFCPENVGNMSLGLPTFLSATPNGIMELFRRYNIETEGKHCVVLGRSNIVGTPMAILLSRNTNPGNATVTIAHSRTKNLKELCASADILIVAIGKTEFVTADMVKEGAVVIDVGQTRVPDSSKKSGFRNVGDVDFDNVKDKCSYLTYVTGGVGPMTRASLLQNTLKAYQRR